jgi:hypothetical protein
LYDRWVRFCLTTRSQFHARARHGADVFAATYADPERLRGFLSAMSAVSAMPARILSAKFDWNKYKTFMDLGTAQGMVPVTLARDHPHLSGIGFDLPQVQPAFEEFVARHGLAGKLRFQAGDFFKDALPKVDVIVMGHIQHDWDLPGRRRC